MSTATLLARTAHAEWLRVRTVRSSWLLAGTTALAVLGIFLRQRGSPESKAVAAPHAQTGTG